MTRRDGILAALAAMISVVMGNRTATADGNVLAQASDDVAIKVPKGGIYMNLDGWTDFNFSLGSETIKLTPEEIFLALKAPHGQGGRE